MHRSRPARRRRALCREAQLGGEEGGTASSLAQGFFVVGLAGLIVVGGGPQQGLRDMRDSKVRDLDGRMVFSPEKVGGFDVAVNDALVVNYGEIGSRQVVEAQLSRPTTAHDIRDREPRLGRCAAIRRRSRSAVCCRPARRPDLRP